MNTQIKILLIVLLLLNIGFLIGQEVKMFTYGGNGSRSNGTVDIRYYIQSGDRQYNIEEINEEIDLNNYRDDISFVIEIVNLKLGLNNSFSKVRNSDHSRIYYLQATRLNINIAGVQNIGADTIRISAPGGHYGKKANQISYKIDEINIRKKLLFQAKTVIIDGVFGKQWNGITLSKTITLLPKIQENLHNTQVLKVSDSLSTNNSKKKSPHKRSFNQQKSYRNTLQKTEEKETLEDKFWSKIEQNLIADDRENVLERCKIYLTNCTMQIFRDCKYREEALFYIANYSKKRERARIVEQYKEQFPSGKYNKKMEELIALPPITIVPIKKELAKVDFDQKALLVQRIKGGNRPYYVSFFDNQKSKSYAIKRIRFNKENMFVDLKSLEIPEGDYEVKVMDAKGQIFIEKQRVYVSQVFALPKSIKVTVILVFLGILGFLYKKYIHF